MSETSTAVVSSVPRQERGKVLNGTNRAIAICLFALQIMLTFGVSFLPSLLGYFVAQRFFAGQKDVSFLPILVGMAGTGGMLWFLFGQIMRRPWSAAYMCYKARAEFRQRKEPLVDPANPDAVLVEMVPRRRWGHVGGAEDIGFLLIDAERGQLLFEGDHKRYCIPVQALMANDVEVMEKHYDRETGSSVAVGIVVVRFRDAELGERETPFRPMQGGNYLERAHELQRRIATLSAEAPVQA